MTITIFPSFNPHGGIYRANSPEHVIIDEVSGSLTYQGWSGIGSNTGSTVWKIQEIATAGGSVTTITWADGNALYDNVWDDRASLTYS